ncbi:MAG: hypothetical protein MHMPM18_003158 [Marteilia pararefringens]
MPLTQRRNCSFELSIGRLLGNHQQNSISSIPLQRRSVQLTSEQTEKVLRIGLQDTQRPSFNQKLASLPNGVMEQINLSSSIQVMLPSAKTALLDFCMSDLISFDRVISFVQ